MTREEAARITATLRRRYPCWEVRTARLIGGLQVEIHADSFSLFAVIDSEHSVILAALGIAPETAP